MPRPRKLVPTYTRHKPSGQARARVDGRDVYLGPHGSPASREAYARLLADIQAGRVPTTGSSPPASLTVTQAVAAYFRHAREHYPPVGRGSSELTNIRSALRPLRKLYGSTALASFGPVAFEAVRRSMISAGLARGTINNHMGRIRRWAKWCVARELAPADLYHRLKAVDPLRAGHPGVRESPPVLPVPDDQVDAALPHMRPPVRAMVELQRLTGMRPGEAVVMTAGQVDRSEDVWVYRPHRHKTRWRGRTREVFLGPRSQLLLAPWLKADPDAPLFSPADDDLARQAERHAARKTPMTPSQSRRKRKPGRRRPPRDRYCVRAYAHAIARACVLAGIPRWSPNQLRHSAATRVRREYGLDAAQVILGHARADVTQLYAEVDADKARNVARQAG